MIVDKTVSIILVVAAISAIIHSEDFIRNRIYSGKFSVRVLSG